MLLNSFIIREDVLHYATRFLERWEEKAPNQPHKKACKDMRALSDFLLENKGLIQLKVVRQIKD